MRQLRWFDAGSSKPLNLLMRWFAAAVPVVVCGGHQKSVGDQSAVVPRRLRWSSPIPPMALRGALLARAARAMGLEEAPRLSQHSASRADVRGREGLAVNG
jgi:hypothetical protein